MKTMKAARLYGPKDLRMMDIPRPEVGPHDVLCKVARVGLCATDLAIYTGEFSFVKSGAVPFPVTLGHEWSGVVTEIGKEVQGFRPGDRVVGDAIISCGHCPVCLLGQYYRCPQMRCVGTVKTWDGAFAEYVLFPERHLFHLPESVSMDQGSLVEPAATALYSVQLAEIPAGGSVLVFGTGPIGILAAKLAKLSGAAKVLIAGRKQPKLQAALAFGADVAIDTTRQSLAEVVNREVGEEGVDRIVDAAGSVELLHQAAGLIRPYGIISVVAFYERKINDFDVDTLVFKSLTLRGVCGSLGTAVPALNFMAAGLLDPTSLITGRYAFADIHTALRDMEQQNDSRIKLLVEMD